VSCVCGVGVWVVTDSCHDGENGENFGVEKYAGNKWLDG